MYTETIVPETLVTTYLQMTHTSQFQPAYVQASDVSIRQMKHVDIDFYRFLYRSVGEKWRWRDRLSMSNRELEATLSDPDVHVYVLYVSGAPAGYIELANRRGDVEVAYFGLREPFMGRGLGKHLLSYGIEQAWALGAHRIWLHTCNLDGPHALANYQKRGFAPYMREEEEMPEVYT
jgi:GNAT superfamily N-acetyltransferase